MRLDRFFGEEPSGTDLDLSSKIITSGKPFESRIISEDELTTYLDEGWDLVKELSNGKIVIMKSERLRL